MKTPISAREKKAIVFMEHQKERPSKLGRIWGLCNLYRHLEEKLAGVAALLHDGGHVVQVQLLIQKVCIHEGGQPLLWIRQDWQR